MSMYICMGVCHDLMLLVPEIVLVGKECRSLRCRFCLLLHIRFREHGLPPRLGSEQSLQVHERNLIE